MMHHQMNKGTSKVRADQILTQEITTGEHCLKTHRLQISWAEGDVKDSLAGKKFELIRDVLRAFGALDPRHFRRSQRLSFKLHAAFKWERSGIEQKRDCRP